MLLRGPSPSRSRAVTYTIMHNLQFSQYLFPHGRFCVNVDDLGFRWLACIHCQRSRVRDMAVL